MLLKQWSKDLIMILLNAQEILGIIKQ